MRSHTLSDGCKVTLSAMHCYGAELGNFPSLAEISRLRGVTEMTIRNHLTEAVSKGVLLQTRHERGSVFAFDWNVLARSVGYACEEDVVLSTVVQIRMPKGAEEEDLRARTKRPANSSELLPYFKAIYREKMNKSYTLERADKNRLRNLAAEFGVASVTDMIDFFSTHRGRLMLGPFSISVLFKQKNKIQERMKKKKI